MGKTILRHHFLIIPVLFLCCGFFNCTGEECAASQTITSDRDSDCIQDDSDNCPRTYNPNQEDTDEDDFGDACEAVECIDDSECVGINYTLHHTGYNLRGLYESSNKDLNCTDFDIVSITQSANTVTLTTESGQTLQTNLIPAAVGNIVTLDLNNNDFACTLSYHTKTFSYTMRCHKKNFKDSCDITGQRTLIELDES